MHDFFAIFAVIRFHKQILDQLVVTGKGYVLLVICKKQQNNKQQNDLKP